MNWEISQSTGFNVLKVDLNADEKFYAQPRSMVSMTIGLKVKAIIGGNSQKKYKLFDALKGTLAGENLFTTEFSTLKDNQTLILAPDAVGKIIEINLRESPTIKIAKGSFLAHSEGVHLESQFMGIKGLMAKKGLYIIKASGEGVVFLSSYGDIIVKELLVDEKIAIDNDYVIAFEEGVKFELVTVTEGLKDSYFSGEGLVNRYTGPGKVYYQTRSKVKSGIISSVLANVT